MGRWKAQGVEKKDRRSNTNANLVIMLGRAVIHLSSQRGWSSSILAGNVLYSRQIKSIAVIPYSPKSISYMFATFKPV